MGGHLPHEDISRASFRQCTLQHNILKNYQKLCLHHLLDTYSSLNTWSHTPLSFSTWPQLTQTQKNRQKRIHVTSITYTYQRMSQNGPSLALHCTEPCKTSAGAQHHSSLSSPCTLVQSMQLSILVQFSADICNAQTCISDLLQLHFWECVECECASSS